MLQVVEVLPLDEKVGISAPDLVDQRPRDTEAAQQRAAFDEINESLDRFFSLLPTESRQAYGELFDAQRRTLKMWPRVDHPVLLRLIHAYSLWFSRHQQLVPNGISADHLHESVMMSSPTPGEKALLLRSIWYASAKTNLRLAYDTADSLRRCGHLDEAREVVSSAVNSFPRLRRAEIDQDSHEMLGLYYLNVKLMSASERAERGWSDLLTVNAEAQRRRNHRPYAQVNNLAWQVLAADELVAIASLSCDSERLEIALGRSVEAEVELLAESPFGMNENLLLRRFEEVSPLHRVVGPLQSCGNVPSPIPELVLQRLLVRYEAWRFRLDVVTAARQSDDEFVRETLDILATTRRLQAQIQMREEDERLEAELKAIPYERVFVPPPEASEIAIAWLELSSAAASMESILVEETILTRARARESTSKLVEKLRDSLSPEESFVFASDIVDDNGAGSVLFFVLNRERAVSWHLLPTSQPASISQSDALPGRAERAQVLVSGSGLKEASLRESGRVLFDPIEDLVDGKKRLTLLARGPLRRIPWQALKDPKGRYLGDRFEIRHVLSASDSWSKHSNLYEGSEIMLVGPEYHPRDPRQLKVPLASRRLKTQFQPLPGVVREVVEISEVLKRAGIPYRLLLGDDAVEGRAWGLRSPQVLHVAGHGFRIADQDMGLQIETSVPGGHNFGWPFERSSGIGMTRYQVGIAFSDFNVGNGLPRPDGLLTAAEVIDLNLGGTKLVVLSACETASPIDEHVTGPFDLALAFRQTGASSVVASLWRVDDEATERFMKSLYESLVAGESVVSAARRARLEVRKDARFSDPYYWAGFEVFGENVRLASDRRGDSQQGPGDPPP